MTDKPIITTNSGTVTIDARQFILDGGEPFHMILEQVAHLNEHGELILRTPFEPLPMMKQLETIGFTVSSQKLDVEDWQIVAKRS